MFSKFEHFLILFLTLKNGYNILYFSVAKALIRLRLEIRINSAGPLNSLISTWF